jgi:hypothetical protein
MNNQRTSADIEREIEDILLEYMSYPTYTRQTTASNERGFNNSQLNAIINTMDRYNRNMQTYNQNMQQYLAFLQNQRVTEPETTRPMRNPYRSGRANHANTTNNIYENTFTTLLSSFYRPRNMHRRPISSDRALTTEEIHNCATVLEYNTELFSETRCPITWADFEEGEEIYKINRCGHIFKKEPLLQWFSQHNHCPVCRGNVNTDAVNNAVQSQSNLVTETARISNDRGEMNNRDNIYNTINHIEDSNSSINQYNTNNDNLVNTSFRNNDLSNNSYSILRENTNYLINTLLNGLFNTSDTIQTFTIDLPIYYDVSGGDVYFDVSMNR